MGNKQNDLGNQGCVHMKNTAAKKQNKNPPIINYYIPAHVIKKKNLATQSLLSS